MKKLMLPFVLALGLVFVAGCKREDKPPTPKASQETAPTPATASEPAAPFAGARPTSFSEVTSQLDPGGTLFAYLAVDQWLQGLATNLLQIRQAMTALPGMAGEDSQQVALVFDLLARLVQSSGIEDVTGVGLSSAQIGPELYRAKFILHHREGAGQGFLWSMFGRAPHSPRALDLLPANTALAAFGDLNVTELWQVIERELTRSGVPAAAEAARAWPVTFEKQTQIPWTKLLASLGGEVGLMLSFDETQQVSLPGPGGAARGMQIPAPALLLAVKVNDDLLFDRISAMLQGNPRAVLTQEAGLKLCSMPIPMPVPLPVQLTVASSGDYFYVATAPEAVRTVQEVRAGKRPGLKTQAEYKNLARHVPAEGNHFFYVSRLFNDTLSNLQKESLRSSPLGEEQLAVIQRLFGRNQTGASLAVGGHLATGWKTVSVGPSDSAPGAMLLPAVGGTAVGAALLLPALAKAKSRAQSISSVNNMKQIGLAARMYANDHQDKFPPAETWCEALKDDLGGNFKVLKAPNDGGPGQCSYAFNAKLSGREDGKVDPQTVMFFETESGWNQRGGPEIMISQPRAGGKFVVGFADGSVRQITPAEVGTLRWDP